MFDPDALSNRVAHLERQNRAFKKGIGAIALLLIVVVVSGQALPQEPPRPASAGRTLEAEKFILKDTNGMVRGEWKVAPDGTVGLLLHDGAGKERGAWFVHADGSTDLRLTGADGKAGITLDSRLDGRMGIALRDRRGTERGSWVVYKDGLAGFTVDDQDGRVRGAWVVDPAGGVTLSLADKSEVERTQWGILPDGRPFLTLLDTRGKKRGIWTTNGDETALAFLDKNGAERGKFLAGPGGVFLMLRDRYTRARAVLSCMSLPSERAGSGDAEFPMLVLFDEKGTPIFEGP
jgi:hypothetical protein